MRHAISCTWTLALSAGAPAPALAQEADGARDVGFVATPVVTVRSREVAATPIHLWIIPADVAGDEAGGTVTAAGSTPLPWRAVRTGRR